MSGLGEGDDAGSGLAVGDGFAGVGRAVLGDAIATGDEFVQAPRRTKPATTAISRTLKDDPTMALCELNVSSR